VERWEDGEMGRMDIGNIGRWKLGTRSACCELTSWEDKGKTKELQNLEKKRWFCGNFVIFASNRTKRKLIIYIKSN